MRAKRTGKLMGLETKSLAPASKQLTISSSSSFVVAMMTGSWVAVWVLRSSRRVSRPLRFGMWTSRIMRSGFKPSAMMSRAFFPSTAAVTV